MAADFRCILLTTLLTLKYNRVHSQLNDTNVTSFETTESYTSTLFFTTIEPSTAPSTAPSSPTTQPSSSPTQYPTNNPSFSPTYEGCSAIHGYVETSETNIGNNGQINSYPLNYPPYQYNIYNLPIIAFPPHTNDPCDISMYDSADIQGKVVLIDAVLTAAEEYPNNCNYQQWTLNMQNRGAKGLLIGVNTPFTNYNGNSSLPSPRIPTRFISDSDMFALVGALCGLEPVYDCSVNDIYVTLDCFNNTAPALICIDDTDYAMDINRMNGNYEQSIAADSNNHPIWVHDATYNVGSSTDWEIYFDVDVYFNWAIRGDFIGTIAYCNDSLFAVDDPTNCSVWYKLSAANGIDFTASDTLKVQSGLCVAPLGNETSANMCIRSQNAEMVDYEGTYAQLIADIPEWFYTNEDESMVAILTWTDLIVFPGKSGYGWELIVNDGGSISKLAVCYYSATDVSEEDTWIKYRPDIMCPENGWLDHTGQGIDVTFDIDGNVCETDMSSNVTLICVEVYENDVYAPESGVYNMSMSISDRDGDGTTDIFMYSHPIWISDGGHYTLLYYEISDAWVIILDFDINLPINESNIIAQCADVGIYDNPTQCTGDPGWEMIGSDKYTIAMNSISASDECRIPTMTTTQETIVTTGQITVTEDRESDDGANNSGNKEILAGFGMMEFIAIGAALLAFPLCIVCFVCYQKRKEKRKHTFDQGVALTPYVPTGMAYDSYKQNQTMQANLAKEAAKKKQAKDAKKKMGHLKTAPPTSIASASVDVGSTDDELQQRESTTANSRNALINVFDEDDAPQKRDSIVGKDSDNPFMRDGIIRTGTTVDETHIQMDTRDIINAFDD